MINCKMALLFSICLTVNKQLLKNTWVSRYLYKKESFDVTVEPYKIENITINTMFIECRIGLYGYNCSNQCSSNCGIESQCDRFTGHCKGGCKSGWTGQMCDQGNCINVIKIK